MFVAYFSQLVQSSSKRSQQPQVEFDEFGDSIEDDQLTLEQREIRNKFYSAADVLPKIIGLLDGDTILKLYALYKQATIGEADISKRPSLLDFRGRTKFDAWQNLGKMDKYDAMKEYTAIVDAVTPVQGNSKGSQGFGLKPSALSRQEEEVDSFDNSEKWFYAAKTGNIGEIQRMIREDQTVLNSKDNSLGMTALLWAADAGHNDIVITLLEHGADINAVDNDGNTSLHLAAICGHNDLYQLLINSGANIEAVNNDDETAEQLLEGN